MVSNWGIEELNTGDRSFAAPGLRFGFRFNGVSFSLLFSLSFSPSNRFWIVIFFKKNYDLDQEIGFLMVYLISDSSEGM